MQQCLQFVNVKNNPTSESIEATVLFEASEIRIDEKVLVEFQLRESMTNVTG